MNYYCYGNGGIIDSVIKRELNYNSFYASNILEIINKTINVSLAYKFLGVKDVYIKYYGYDERLKRDVYMMLNSKKICGYKDQFMKFIIEN